MQLQQIAFISPFSGIIDEIRKLDKLPPCLLEKVCAIPEEGGATTSRSSAADLIQNLAETFSPPQVGNPAPAQRTWELVGLLYMRTNRNAEALETFRKLYDHILVAHQPPRSAAHV